MEFKIGNIYMRDNHSPHVVGDTVGGHCHNFDHARLIVQGSYRCRVWRKVVDASGADVIGPDGNPVFHVIYDKVCTGPHLMNVEANDMHSFECVAEPGILWCLYSHRRPQGKAVQVITGLEVGEEDVSVVVTAADGTVLTSKVFSTDPRLQALIGGKLDDPDVIQHWMGNRKAVE